MSEVRIVVTGPGENINYHMRVIETAFAKHDVICLVENELDGCSDQEVLEVDKRWRDYIPTFGWERRPKKRTVKLQAVHLPWGG